MLDEESNRLLTEAHAGSALGDQLQRYWIPAALPEDLPHPEAPPIRLELLGKSLVAFRSRSDGFGLLEAQCAHRGASLYFGRCEEDGLRCAYHGWKYDTTGKCIEMPSEPPQSRFKERIQLESYPFVERGGVLWAYLGEGSPPPLPDFEWMTLADSHRFVSRRIQDTNFVQALEGGIDASHVSVLHSDARLWNRLPATREMDMAQTSPRFYVRSTEYGLVVAAERVREDGRRYIRITQYIMPWYTLIAPFSNGFVGAHAFVPMDDERTVVWSIEYRLDRTISAEEVADFRRDGGIHAEVLPGTLMPIRNAANDYLVDRTAQRLGSVSGIRGIANQDAAMQESMGPVADRPREHLGSSDVGIVMARRRLLELAAAGRSLAILPGVDPAAHQVCSAVLLLDPGDDWETAARSETRGKYRVYGDAA